MAIIEINDIPIATLKPSNNPICLVKIAVSSAIDVNNPLMIAKVMMLIVLHPESVNTNWKAAMVPKSPMLQPIKHHLVL